MLEQAHNLVKSLDEADEAQEKAKAAIEQANEDIALAKADLEKVCNFCSKNRFVVMFLIQFLLVA